MAGSALKPCIIPEPASMVSSPTAQLTINEALHHPSNVKWFRINNEVFSFDVWPFTAGYISADLGYWFSNTYSNAGTEDDPYHIEVYTAAQFAKVVKCLMGGMCLDPKDWTIDDLELFLSFGFFWNAKQMIQYGLRGLEAHDISPSRRLHFARCFGIRQWIRPNVEILVFAGARNLTPMDSENLAPNMYFIVSKAASLLDAERMRRALITPLADEPTKFLSPNCTSHHHCVLAWNYWWWNTLGRKLLHPIHPIGFISATALLQSATIRRMHPDCKEIVVEQVVRDGELGAEKDVVDHTVQEIERYIFKSGMPPPGAEMDL